MGGTGVAAPYVSRKSLPESFLVKSVTDLEWGARGAPPPDPPTPPKF